MANRSRRKVDMSKARRRLATDDKRIKIVVGDNPRRMPTNAGKRWAAMVKYVRKHRTATAKDVLRETDYGSNDLSWDLEHGNIKLVSA